LGSNENIFNYIVDLSMTLITADLTITLMRNVNYQNLQPAVKFQQPINSEHNKLSGTENSLNIAKDVSTAVPSLGRARFSPDDESSLIRQLSKGSEILQKAESAAFQMTSLIEKMLLQKDQLSVSVEVSASRGDYRPKAEITMPSVRPSIEDKDVKLAFVEIKTVDVGSIESSQAPLINFCPGCAS
jgi:hypothetical protein